MVIAGLMGNMPLARLNIEQDRTICIAFTPFRGMPVPLNVGEMTGMHVGNALFLIWVIVLVICPGRCHQQDQGSERND